MVGMALDGGGRGRSASPGRQVAFTPTLVPSASQARPHALLLLAAGADLGWYGAIIHNAQSLALRLSVVVVNCTSS